MFAVSFACPFISDIENLCRLVVNDLPQTLDPNYATPKNQTSETI